ncbi:Kinesin- protein 12 [Homalodisca vitripennis]|nr:Kinesin- protein 12 [Homalodisca vitripennis]
MSQTGICDKQEESRISCSKDPESCTLIFPLEEANCEIIYSRSVYEQSLSGSQSSLDPFTPEDNINVVVRVRPLGEKELRRNDPSVISFPGNGQIMLDGLSGVPGHTGGKSKLFSYNVVFEPGATQEDVFQFSGVKRLVGMAVEGFSTTVFCYGQTGSGKTHTLTGPPGLVEKNADPFSPNHGLVFRSFMYLFQTLQEMRDTHFVLKASFLEIYNEKSRLTFNLRVTSFIHRVVVTSNSPTVVRVFSFLTHNLMRPIVS